MSRERELAWQAGLWRAEGEWVRGRGGCWQGRGVVPVLALAAILVVEAQGGV